MNIPTLSISSDFNDVDTKTIRSSIKSGLVFFSVGEAINSAHKAVLLAVGTIILAYEMSSMRTWYTYDGQDNDTLQSWRLNDEQPN